MFIGADISADIHDISLVLRYGEGEAEKSGVAEVEGAERPLGGRLVTRGVCQLNT